MDRLEKVFLFSFLLEMIAFLMLLVSVIIQDGNLLFISLGLMTLPLFIMFIYPNEQSKLQKAKQTLSLIRQGLFFCPLFSLYSLSKVYPILCRLSIRSRFLQSIFALFCSVSFVLLWIGFVRFFIYAIAFPLAIVSTLHSYFFQYVLSYLLYYFLYFTSTFHSGYYLHFRRSDGGITLPPDFT